MIELIKLMPTWLIILFMIPAGGMVFLIKPGIAAYNAWRTTNADTRKINAETDLKLIDEYKDLLGEFRHAIEAQKEENLKLQADNKRLHEVTESLIKEAARLHDFVKGCLDQLHDSGVPTDMIPGIPELEILKRKQ